MDKVAQGTQTPTRDETLQGLVQEEHARGSSYRVIATRAVALDPATGAAVPLGYSSIYAIAKGRRVDVSALVLLQLAAGLRLPPLRVAAAAIREYLGVPVVYDSAVGLRVVVDHDEPGLWLDGVLAGATVSDSGPDGEPDDEGLTDAAVLRNLAEIAERAARGGTLP